MADSKLKPDSSFAWVVWVVVFFASVVGPLCQFKMPPLAGEIMPYFGIMPNDFGVLMSCMSIVGFILAFPTVFIIRKIGLKGGMIFALITLIIGTALEIFAASGLSTEGGSASIAWIVLLVGRIIEGTGIAILGVAGSAILTIWFSEKKRSFPLALWATWFPLGTIIMFLGAPPLEAAMGWSFQTIWWICLILVVLALITFVAVFKYPETENKEEVMITASFSDCMKTLKNKNIWLLGVVFFCFNYFTLGVLNSFYNQYIQGVWLPQLPIPEGQGLASSISIVATVVALVMMPIVGAIANKTGKRKILMIIGSVLLLVGLIPAFIGGTIDTNGLAVLGSDGAPVDVPWVFIWAFLLIAGSGVAVIASAARPMAPEVMEPTALGATMSMTVLQFLQQLSATAGPIVFGSLLQANSGGFMNAGNMVMSQSAWAIAGYATLIPLMIISLICAFLVKAK
jgi:MFS family permease